MARTSKPDLTYINQKDDGTYWFDIRLTRPDGTPFRKPCQSKSLEKIIRKRDEALAEFAAGTNSQGYTVGSWCDYCLEHIYPTATNRQGKPYGAKTIQGYRQIIEAYIKPTIGDVRLASLTHEHVDRMLAATTTLTSGSKSRRMDDGTQTKINTRNVLSGVLEWGIKRGKIDRNVCKGVSIAKSKLKKTEDGEVIQSKRILTDDEAAALLSWAKGTWGYCAILLGLKCGLRIGEALGATWSAIDWHRRTIKVRQQAQRVTGAGYNLVDPKTTTSIRTIPLPPSVYEALKAEREVNTCGRYITCNSRDNMVEQSKMHELMRDLSDLAGLSDDFDANGAPLPAPTFHDLRSTFCTTMAVKHKVDPGTLIKLSGHSNVKTLLEYYVKASDEDVFEAMKNVA